MEKFRNTTHTMLTAEEEASLFQAYWAGDMKAGHAIVVAHRPLVNKMAWRMRGGRTTFDDMCQEGEIGLVRALPRFDPEQGVRFNTYARWWVRAALSEYLIKSQSMVGISADNEGKRLYYNLRKVKNRLGILHDGDLKRDEAERIATELRSTPEAVILMDRQLSAGYVSSIDAPLGAADSSGTRLDLMADPADIETDVIERLDEERAVGHIRSVLPDLKPRDRDIIERRTIGGCTLQDLAETYGVSRERIRQLEVKALQTVRDALADRFQYAF